MEDISFKWYLTYGKIDYIVVEGILDLDINGKTYLG